MLEPLMHNAVLPPLNQTGFTGTIPFLRVLFWGLFLLLKTPRRLKRLATAAKTPAVPDTGVLAILTLRVVPESNKAFFGADWLLLGPLLVYIQVVASASVTVESERQC